MSTQTNRTSPASTAQMQAMLGAGKFATLNPHGPHASKATVPMFTQFLQNKPTEAMQNLADKILHEAYKLNMEIDGFVERSTGIQTQLDDPSIDPAARHHHAQKYLEESERLHNKMEKINEAGRFVHIHRQIKDAETGNSGRTFSPSLVTSFNKAGQQQNMLEQAARHFQMMVARLSPQAGPEAGPRGPSL